MRRLQWSLALAVAVSVTCSDRHVYDKPARPVRVFTVAGAAAAGSVRYSASIRASEQIPLAFKVGGYVEEILQKRGSDGSLRALQKGDRVKSGEVLARLRTDDYLERSNQARSRVEETRAGEARASQDFERANRLFASHSLTKAELDAARAQRDASRAQRKGATAMLEEAQLALADAALTAPRDAIVLDRLIEVGTLVGPRSVGFLIADVSSVKAVFGAPETIIETLRLGDTLTISTQSTGAQEVTGRISAISPWADPLSRVFDVEVTIPNPLGSLKPGMIASVALADGDAGAGSRTGSTVPLSAVVRPPGRSEGYAVYVVEEQGEEQRARFREVTLGQVYANRITILEGVAEGERVIVTGATLVVDGEGVRIIPGS